MSNEHAKRDNLAQAQVSEPAGLGRESSPAKPASPGIRPLIKSQPAPVPPVQRRSLVSQLPKTEVPEGPIESWTNAVFRPDLYKQPVLRKSRNDGGTVNPGQPATGNGRPMPDQIQEKMEQSFGTDFSAVRIHEGPQATAMGALAYTQGTDIHFAPGQYDPSSQRGQELLGHELTHVVQQAQGRVEPMQAKGMNINNDASLEREADEMGARAAAGQSTALSGQATQDSRAKTDMNVCPTCGTSSASGSCQSCKAADREGSHAPAAAPVAQRQAAPGGMCHGTNRTAGPQHEAIQRDYISRVDPSGIREYAIPSGSASGAVGYADLVSMSTGAIYEIKPYIPSEITQGLTQVSGYVQAALQSCNASIPWHPGARYPDRVIPFGTKELVAKQYNHPGLILYYERNRQEPERVPVPVPVPERETETKREINWRTVGQVLLGLGLSLALIPVVIAALADPEPATKLALAGLSVVMITAILDAFGIEHDVPQA